MLGIVVQRVIRHLDVGAGRPGPVAVRELGDDVVLHLLNAVIGKGRDTAAIGDGDILAGTHRQQEEDAAFALTAAKTVVYIIILGKIPLVGIADVVDHKEIDVAIVAAGSRFRALFQLVVGIGIKQAHLVPDQGSRRHTGQSQHRKHQQSGQKSTALL